MSPEHTVVPRPVDWRTWYLWVAACASAEALFALAATAFEAGFDAYPFAVFGGLGILLPLLAMNAMPVLLQWAVLRRIAPKLRWWTWLAAASLAWGLSMSLEIAGVGLDRISQEFSLAARSIRTSGGYDLALADVLGLPWGDTLVYTGAVAVVTLLPLCALLARASGIRWPVVLIAAVAGACTATTVAQIYLLNGVLDDLPGLGRALQSRFWSDRMGELCLRAATGAIWGATSALVISRFVSSREAVRRASRFAMEGRSGLAVMLGSMVLIVVLAPVCAIGFVPYKAEAASAKLRRAFTFAPSEDRSSGEEVIRYSHSVPVKPARYVEARFAPDGRNFLMVTADGRLARIEVTSGELMGFVGDPLGRFSFHDEAWSPDGSYLALRSDGDDVITPYDRYRKARVRVRVLAAPGYTAVGEYVHRGDECFNYAGSGPSVMFAAEGKTLWVVCGHYVSPKPDSVMAIRLEVPSMRLLEVRRFGDRAVGERVNGLASVGSSIWYWQGLYGVPKRLLVRDLTNDRDVVALNDLDRVLQTDNFFLGGIRPTQDRIGIGYRVGSPGQGTHREGWMVFDVRSGALLEKREQPGPPKGVTRYSHDLPNDLRVETTFRDDSRAGDLEVFDGVAGRRLQHLSTPAQRLAGLSPDGRWLVMNAFDQRVLRIYRVTP